DPETWICFPPCRQIFQSHTGYHHHDGCYCDLRRHENLAEWRSRADDACIGRSHELIEIASGATECWNESGQDTRSCAYSERKQRHERASTNAEREGNKTRTNSNRTYKTGHQRGKSKPVGCCRCRRHTTLDDELADQPRSCRTQREPHRRFTRPRGCG